jgi:hypothetical protein
MARSIPGASRTLTGLTSILSDGAATWMTPNWAGPVGTAGSLRTATRATLGAISFRSSSHFAAIPYSLTMNPVALPPGRARLSTNPAATGSLTIGKTTGTGRLQQRSHGRSAMRQDDVGCEGDQFRHVSANFVGMAGGPARLDPRVAADVPAQQRQPLQERPDANLEFRIIRRSRQKYPMRRGGSPCCPRAAIGHAAALPSSVMNSRRFTRSPRRRAR